MLTVVSQTLLLSIYLPIMCTIITDICAYECRNTRMAFQLAYLPLSWASFKAKWKVMHISIVSMSYIVTDGASIIIIIVNNNNNHIIIIIILFFLIYLFYFIFLLLLFLLLLLLLFCACQHKACRLRNCEIRGKLQ